MKKYIAMITLICITFLCIGCANESDNTSAEESILTAPNGMKLAEDFDDLKNNLTGSTEDVEINEVIFFDLNPNSDKMVAQVDFTFEGNNHKILVLRNIEDIKFEQGTTIKYDGDEQFTSRQGNGDIYISCEGLGCCYPQGSINMETGEVSTACKCEGDPGSNSSCVMKVSKIRPVGND